MVPDDTRVFFHISSKKYCDKTDSVRFQRLLFESMGEMKDIYEEYLKTKKNWTVEYLKMCLNAMNSFSFTQV